MIQTLELRLTSARPQLPNDSVVVSFAAISEGDRWPRATTGRTVAGPQPPEGVDSESVSMPRARCMSSRVMSISSALFRTSRYNSLRSS